MEAFILYFLSVNLLLLLQAGYYRLFLARQRRFQWNRIYLVGGMAVALLLPLLHLEVVPPSLPNPSFIQALPEIVVGAELAPNLPDAAPALMPVTASAQVIATAAWTPSIFESILAVYLLGVAIALSTLLWRNLAILRLIAWGKKTRHAGYTLVATSADIGPASYFRYIFWNAEGDLDAQSAAVAMAHERCHSRQLHSLDLLGAELLKVFCWINPAVYLLRKDLRQTHEYLADQAALEVAGVEGIKRLLLAQQIGSRQLSITNSFYSHIKARIMVLTEKSKRKTILQYILVLPLAGLMVACTSLAHPMDAQQPQAAAEAHDSTQTSAATPISNESGAYPQFYSIDDRLIEATLPAGQSAPNSKGTVCLGRQPQTLNLDTILSLDELENVANHPYLLNRKRVMEAIGYPQEAKAQGIKGKVLARILVDETGHVARYSFINDCNAILRDAVQLHIKELLFKPGKEDGKPSEWWVIMPFGFGLPGC
jgi:Gram-negative bacterial TonB protein C-terminal